MQGPQGSQDVAIATASKQPRQLLKVLDAVLDVYGFRKLKHFISRPGNKNNKRCYPVYEPNVRSF